MSLAALLMNALFMTYIIYDVHAQTRSFTRLILDDMAAFFGEGEFPSADFEKLQRCFAKWGDNELESRQDIAWKKFIQFYETSNSSNDFFWWDDKPRWYESIVNVTGTFGNGDGNRSYLIKGPCNYVSNVAYYRAAMRACDYEDWNVPESYLKSLKQAYSSLAFASACFHGGETRACRLFDSKLSGLPVYAAYQIMARNLRTNNPRVIFGLREDIEPLSFMEVSQNFSDITTNDDIQLWQPKVSENAFTADAGYSGAAFSSLACSVSLPVDFCRFFVSDLVFRIILDDPLPDFFQDFYFPELKIVVKENNLPLPFFVRLPLLIRTIASLTSFVFALFWNEGFFDVSILTGNVFNLTRLGAYGAGFLEGFTSFLTGYETNEENLATRTNVYPGDDYCNVVSPHALWHQESADVIMDLALLANDIDRLLQEHLNCEAAL